METRTKAGLSVLLMFTVVSVVVYIYTEEEFPLTQKIDEEPKLHEKPVKKPFTEKKLRSDPRGPFLVEGIHLAFSYDPPSEIQSLSVDNTILVGTSNGEIVSIDPKTGEELRFARVGKESIMGVVTKKDLVVVATRNGFIKAYDANTLGLATEEVWVFATEGSGQGEPVLHLVASDKEVYAGSNDHKIYCLDLLTGKEKWSYRTGDKISAVALADNLIVVGSRDKKVYAFDKNTGRKAWEFPTKGFIGSIAVSTEKGLVAVGSWDRGLYILNLESGKARWRRVLPGVVTSVAITNNLVLAGDQRGTLLAYTLDGQKAWVFKERWGVVKKIVPHHRFILVGEVVSIPMPGRSRIYLVNPATGGALDRIETRYMLRFLGVSEKIFVANLGVELLAYTLPEGG